MGFWDKAREIIREVVEFFTDRDNQEILMDIVKAILTIVQAVGVLNEPIPKRDRPKTVRTTIEILQKLSPEDLRVLANVKESTNFDDLTSGELDSRIGQSIGGYINLSRKKSGKTFRG